MKHIDLTCENHPDLRWNCKEIAVNEEGRYNGRRSIFFQGTPDEECTCNASKLITVEKYEELHN